jgi:hypothetical protein
MSSTKSSYLNITNGYIDSLINYVLDVKPYHVKLSEIVEEFLFNEDINVKMKEHDHTLVFLGPDILPSTRTATGVRLKRSQSWSKELTSDGQRAIWRVPLTSTAKFASHSNQNVFNTGSDRDLQIPGIENMDVQNSDTNATDGNFVFNPRRWDGPGIPDVRIDGNNQQESYDYDLSRGVFSFDTKHHQMWKELNLDINELVDTPSNPKFANQQGYAIYPNVAKPFGTLSNVYTEQSYEEWTVTWVDGSDGPVFEIKYPNRDSIGNRTYTDISGTIEEVFNVVSPEIDYSTNTYTVYDNTTGNVLIMFTYTVNALGIEIALGDSYTLTPSSKIVVSNDTLPQTWSLIKTNPIVITSPSRYISNSDGTGDAFVNVYTKSLDYVAEPYNWYITFFSATEYDIVRVQADLNGNDLVEGNSVNVGSGNLANNFSFKNEYVHFTIIPNTTIFGNGDQLVFSSNHRTANYKVYSGGSEGMQAQWWADAKIGEYYWNGHIGFKIPKLEMFAEMENSTIITSSSGDDNTWDTAITNTQVLHSIEQQNGIFVTAGEDGIVGGSVDGATWASDLASIFTPTGNERFITVGTEGLIALSTPVAKWTEINPGTGVANGMQWQPQASHTTANLNGSTMVPDFMAMTDQAYQDYNYNGDTNVAAINAIIVVGDAGTIITSVNGIGWASQVSNTSQNLNAVTWGADFTNASNDNHYRPRPSIVAVGNNGAILWSNDRLNWFEATGDVYTNPNLYSVIYEPISGVFIAVGSNGTILRSEDYGHTWLNLNPFAGHGTLPNFTDIAFGNGMYVAVSSNGYVAESTDGITWTSYHFKSLNGIAFGNGIFVAVGGQKTDYTAFYQTPGYDVNSVAEPSTYVVKFVTSSIPETATTPYVPATATVFNNLYGYKSGLKAGQTWTDDLVSFKLLETSGMLYAKGDVVKVHLTPMTTLSQSVGYDRSKYDASNYDEDIGETKIPLFYDQQYFELYHSYGSVIFQNFSDTNSLIIDKVYNDRVRFKIVGSGAAFPELGSHADWLPIDLHVATFADLSTTISAYSGANPDQLIFTIDQPRYLSTNFNASALLTFDPIFLRDYLPFNTKFQLEFLPDEDYGQTINVKISEDIRIYSRIHLDLFDGPMWNNQTGTAFRGSYYFPYDWVNKTYHMNTPTPFRGYQQYPFVVNINDTHFDHYETLASMFISENYMISVVDATNISTTLNRSGVISGYNLRPYNENDNTPYGGADDIDAATTGIAEGLSIIEHRVTEIPTGYEAIQYDYFTYDQDMDLQATRYHIFYDYNKHPLISSNPMSLGLNVFAPGQFNPSLPVSATNNPYAPVLAPGKTVISAEEYVVQVLNRVYARVPDMWVQSIDGDGNLIPGTPTFVIATLANVFPQIPDMTNPIFNAFLFVSPLNFPFRLTIANS